MKEKIITLIIAYFSTALTCSAQDLTRVADQKYFFLGVAFSGFRNIDEAHSPLRYVGNGLMLRFGFEEINPNFVSRIAVNVMFGSGAPKFPHGVRSQSNVEVSFFDVSYSYYRHTHAANTEGWQRYAGGTAFLSFDFRDYVLPSNNLSGFQINAGLSAGGHLDKKMGEKWRFSYEPNAALLTYSVRPSYIGLTMMQPNGRSSIRKVLSSGHFATVNRFFRFTNRISFDQQSRPWRTNRYFYLWDWTNNRTAQTLQNINAHLGYESLFRL